MAIGPFDGQINFCMYFVSHFVSGQDCFLMSTELVLCCQFDLFSQTKSSSPRRWLNILIYGSEYLVGFVHLKLMPYLSNISLFRDVLVDFEHNVGVLVNSISFCRR